MSEPYDVIIVGLGAMGSATAFQLARRGLRVLGLDQYTPPHTFGSSHGQTRIIREAYFEDPAYVPLVQRAYVLWEVLETLAGSPLLRQTGGLMIGRPDSEMVSGALRSAQAHGLRYQVFSAEEVRKHFPGLHPEDDMIAVAEPRAGILFPERCIAAHLDLAQQYGAHLQYKETVVGWAPDGAGVQVATSHDTYHAAQLVVTAGAWAQTLFPDVVLPFSVERQILFWFNTTKRTHAFEMGRCPVHLWQFDGHHFFYGFPDLGDGVKVARHHDGETSSHPAHVNRVVSTADVEDMRTVVRRFLPTANGPLRQATVCQYLNTPDEHFWIDRHPDCPAVLLVSPCSGHGFKFASAIGEVTSDLVVNGHSAFDLSLFAAR